MQRKIFLLILAIFLTACQKQQTGTTNPCTTDTAKQRLVQNLEKNVQQQAILKLQQYVQEQDLSVDLAQLRQQLAKWQFNVTDIRTDQTSEQSSKVACTTTFIAKLPADMLMDANTTRNMRQQPDVAQQALMASLELNHTQLHTQIHYAVQPTDDGEKLYVTLENPEPLSSFIVDVSLDALLSSPLQEQVAAEQEYQQQQQLEQAENAQAYYTILMTEARGRRDIANQQINLVWNATSSDIRQHLLPEQRLWLKKRELECKLHSSEADQPEIEYFDCETQMTRARTQFLNAKIQQLEYQVAQHKQGAEAEHVRKAQQQQVERLAQQRQEETTAKAQVAVTEKPQVNPDYSGLEQAIQEAQVTAEKQD